MAIATSTGRPPLATHIDAATATLIRTRVLAGVRLEEIATEIGSQVSDIYNYVRTRKDRWLHDANFESRALAKGHIVVWKAVSRATGSRDLRPITLPGTTIQRNMLAETGR